MRISATRTKTGKRPPVFRIVLEIGTTRYLLSRLRCDDGLGRRAFRLVKDDGTTYDLIQTKYGPECDCPDFIFRRDGLDAKGCKHIQTLKAVGMIS